MKKSALEQDKEKSTLEQDKEKSALEKSNIIHGLLSLYRTVLTRQNHPYRPPLAVQSVMTYTKVGWYMVNKEVKKISYIRIILFFVLS